MDNQAICYEQPLNERVRVLLRLEFLFEQFYFFLEQESTWASRGALQALFEILNLTARSDLKPELRKELDRHGNALSRLRKTAGVDTQALNTILDVVSEAIARIQHTDTVALEEVRQNDFLAGIRQRSVIPGGTCLFDLPGLHHWLLRDPATRQDHLQRWIAPFKPWDHGIELILRLIRDSATATRELAENGFFQRSLDSNAPSQLIRVLLPTDTMVYPEISGGRHRFTIRFMEQADPNQRPTQTTETVAFQLVCCVI